MEIILLPEKHAELKAEQKFDFSLELRILLGVLRILSFIMEIILLPEKHAELKAEQKFEFSLELRILLGVLRILSFIMEIIITRKTRGAQG